MNQPPPIIDCAVVLAYAVHDEYVAYTGRISTYHDGKLVGPEVTRTAICRNLADPSDYLFFYCSEQWEVLAAAGKESLPKVQSYAEQCYSGLGAVFVWPEYSQEEIEAAIEEYWSGRRCDSCRKWPHEVQSLTRHGEQWLCESCT